MKQFDIARAINPHLLKCEIVFLCLVLNLKLALTNEANKAMIKSVMISTRRSERTRTFIVR
jgi:hypothetical protein